MPNYGVQPWMLRPTTNGWDNTTADGDGTHTGADFFAAQGTPVTSPVKGTVTFVYSGTDATGTTAVHGWRVRVRDAFGQQHGFSHLHTIDVKVGQIVDVGTRLGGSGGAKTDPIYKRGLSTGAHIHWGVYSGDSWLLAASQNPVPYLAQRIKEEPIMAPNTRIVGATNAKRRTSPTIPKAGQPDNLYPDLLTFNTPVLVTGYRTDLDPTHFVISETCPAPGSNKFFLVDDAEDGGNVLWSHASTFTDPSVNGIVSLDPVVPPTTAAPSAAEIADAVDAKLAPRFKAVNDNINDIPVPPTEGAIATEVIRQIAN